MLHGFSVVYLHTVSTAAHKETEEAVLRNLGNLCSFFHSTADSGQGSCFFKWKLGFDLQGKFQVFTSSDKFYSKYVQKSNTDKFCRALQKQQSFL